MATSTTLGVKLDEATRDRLKEAARRIERTPHWLIKQAIFSYLEALESGMTLPELQGIAQRLAEGDHDALEALPETTHQPFLEFAESILPQSVLRAAIRPYDICVRYAGDEFIVVLSGCGAEEAEQKRLELQKAIDEVVFEVRPGSRLPLGMSIGAAVFPTDGDSYETLLAAADGQMYRDKTKRKGRLVRAAEHDEARSTPAEPTSDAVRRAAAGIL